MSLNQGVESFLLKECFFAESLEVVPSENQEVVHGFASSTPLHDWLLLSALVFVLVISGLVCQSLYPFKSLYEVTLALSIVQEV